jgi:glucose dehydrogenase
MRPFVFCLMLLVAAEQSPVEDGKARARLPQFQVIPPVKLHEMAASTGKSYLRDYRDWPRSHGDNMSSRYSALRQVHRGNVQQLRVAWTYRSKDGTGNIQCNPIIVDGRMYAPTVGGSIV